MWTSLLPSYQTGWAFAVELEDFLRLLRAAPATPCSVAATLGYRPAHSIAYKRAIQELSLSQGLSWLIGTYMLDTIRLTFHITAP